MRSMFRWPLALWLTLLVSWGVSPVPAAESPNAAAGDAPWPRVLSASGPLQLGEVVTLRLSGLGTWVAAGNSAHPLMLFLDGRPLTGTLPEAVNVTNGTLRYHLSIDPQNRDVWEDLLRRPELSRPVHVTVGATPDLSFPTDLHGSASATLIIIPSPWGQVALLVVLVTLGALVYLGARTDLLRDMGTSTTPGVRKPYSLSRTQMAFWFYLVFSGFIVIWLITGDLNTITESLLGLMGISAGTALGGALIDGQKRATATEELTRLQLAARPEGAAPGTTERIVQLQQQLDPGPCRGFLRDVLSDRQGAFSLHRFQILAWNLALGMIFIASTYTTLRMPEFSATLLGLMGISAGTYLGFKVPEQ